MVAEYAPQREVRLAVVMYGGISLCIYMNGIAQELLALVRSTAPANAERPTEPGSFAIPDAKLEGTERVYRDLARLMGPKGSDSVTVRFVIDVLSGTSAGGLNNMFLAKALAREESLQTLTKLWVEEGDINVLLNDEESTSGMGGLKLRNDRESLLNGDRMYAKLLEALEGMARDPRLNDGKTDYPSRFVDELDLHMTATDLHGLNLPLHLSDKQEEDLYERRHRSVFHFRYSKEGRKGTPDNDFDKPGNLPFMAFVGRCTSCIVPAFMPMRLEDANYALKAYAAGSKFKPFDDTQMQQWGDFFSDYWKNVLLADASHKTRDAWFESFRFRDFGDGGYLDNKPFSYATATLATRRADLPVDRKLFYVEPDPNNPVSPGEPPSKDDPRTNVIEHALAAQTLATFETIREDIQRIRDRNSLLERTKQIREHVERAIENQGMSTLLTGMTQGSPAPVLQGYVRLRISSTTDELTQMLCELLNYESETPYFGAIRHLVQAWREHYFAGKDGEFLENFDFGFRLRRLGYLQRRINGRLNRLADLRQAIGGIFAALEHPHSRAVLELQSGIQAYAADLDAYYARFEEMLASVENGLQSIEQGEGYEAAVRSQRATLEGELSTLEQAYIALKRSLNDIEADIYATRRRIVQDLAAEFARSGTVGNAPLGIKLSDLGLILRQDDEEKRNTLAKDLLGYEPGKEEPTKDIGRDLQRVASEIQKQIHERLSSTDAKTQEVLSAEKLTGADYVVKSFAFKLFDLYEQIDVVVFPIIFGTGATESARVDILRLSPIEATTLETGDRARQKLAGTRLSHFAAFFHTEWRKNDILWGRLDAAERLICTMAKAGNERRTLILRAQLAILGDRTSNVSKEFRGNILRKALDSFNKDTHQALEDCTLIEEAGLSSVEQAILKSLLELESARPGNPKAYEAPQVDGKDQLRLAGRSLRVLSQMFDYLGTDNAQAKPAVKVVGWVGMLLVTIARVLTPGSIAALTFRYLFGLASLFGITLVLLGFIWPAVAGPGWQILGILLVVAAILLLARGFIQSGGRTAFLRKVLLLSASVIGVSGVVALGYVIGSHPAVKHAAQWVLFGGLLLVSVLGLWNSSVTYFRNRPESWKQTKFAGAMITLVLVAILGLVGTAYGLIGMSSQPMQDLPFREFAFHLWPISLTVAALFFLLLFPLWKRGKA